MKPTGLPLQMDTLKYILEFNGMKTVEFLITH